MEYTSSTSAAFDPSFIESRPNKKRVFDLFDDLVDLEEHGSGFSDPISWPSQQDESELTTELLSIPSLDDIVLSGTASLALDDGFALEDFSNPWRTTSMESCVSPTKASGSVPNSYQEPARFGPYRLPDAAKIMLDGWFSANTNDPYLKPGDAAALAHLTGLTEQQVKTYMANRRIRKLGKGGLPPPEEFPAKLLTCLDTAATMRQDSNVSLDSIPSSQSISRRRGRRRFRVSGDCSAALKSNPDRIYHCTFQGCAKDFKRKNDWRRHEQSLHMLQEEYVCLLTAPVTHSGDGQLLVCGFCEAQDASDAHLDDAHRLSACKSKPEPDRTFARKDKLAQHLAQVHGVAAHAVPRLAADWTRPVNRHVTFACGFCGEALAGWQKRTDHVAAHFEDGMTINMWRDEDRSCMPPPPPAFLML